MNTKFIFCFAIAMVARVFGAPLDMDQPNLGDCPDGSPNGAQLERGRYFYECKNGEIVPKGCMTEDLKRITIGQTADKRHYRVECKLASDNVLTLEAVACLHDGRDHKLDEQWEDASNFYTCKSDGQQGLRTVNQGCVDQGKRVPLNEKVVKDEYVMVCNETVNNGARMMQVGCVKEGRQYNAGESFEVDKFWYNCTRTGTEKVATKMSGCVANGKRLNDGDRYLNNEVIHECRIDSSTKGDLITVGCVQRDERGEVVERRVGCTWVEGQEPFQYEMACQNDPATNSAKKVPVRCNYKSGGGVYNIDPGCYRLIDKAAFGCLTESSGLKLQSFQGQDAESAATGAGLHAC